MKKLIGILILLVVAMAGFSQIRTIKADKVLNPDVTSPNSVTWSYIGVAADTLTVLQDTLIYNITLNKAAPFNYYIKVGLDTIAGADTTVVINIKGRMFDDEAWTLVETVTTAAITAEINTVIESMTDPDYTFGIAAAEDVFNADSTTTVAARTITPIPSVKPCWRQIQVEMIIKGNDSVGVGIRLKDIRWYFQEAK
jgi:hypothetical protein